MLSLYHWEPNLSSVRPLICLYEKGLEFASHYVDILAFEHVSQPYLAINPDGQVPALVHNGRVLTESSFICEYLDEVFPGVPLMPSDAYGRWQVHTWQKLADEDLAPSVAIVGWHRCVSADQRAAILARSTDRLALIPLQDRRNGWELALARGYDAARLDFSIAKLRRAIGQLEGHLCRQEWLAGHAYSLADISVFSMLNGLQGVAPELISHGSTPGVLAWLERIRQRPAVQASLAVARTANPVAAFAPGPEQIRWG
jgi:GSH-dependent disulfide-bond oxidoreductase